MTTETNAGKLVVLQAFYATNSGVQSGLHIGRLTDDYKVGDESVRLAEARQVYCCGRECGGMAGIASGAGIRMEARLRYPLGGAEGLDIVYVANRTATMDFIKVGLVAYFSELAEALVRSLDDNAGS